MSLWDYNGPGTIMGPQEHKGAQLPQGGMGITRGPGVHKGATMGPRDLNMARGRHGTWDHNGGPGDHKGALGPQWGGGKL